MDSLQTTLGPGDVVLSFGIFASLLLAVTVLVRMRDNPAANFWLLILLLASLAGMVLKFLDHNELMTRAPHLYRLNRPIGLLRPVALYLYVWYLLNPARSLRWRDALHLLPSLALVAYLWPAFTLSAADKIRLMNHQLYEPRAILPSWYAAAGILYSLGYWALSVRAYLTSGLRAQGARRSRRAEKMRRWIVGFLALSFVFLLLVAATRAASAGPQAGYHFFQFLSIFIVLACLALLSSTQMAPGEIAPRYEKSTLSAEERGTHAESLRRLFESEQLHRRAGLRLSAAAQSLGVPDQVLSQVINEEFGVSFNELVNGYRVETAKELLRSEVHSMYSTEGIGKEAGFGSRASFYSAFKRVTGVTPAAYRKQDPE